MVGLMAMQREGDEGVFCGFGGIAQPGASAAVMVRDLWLTTSSGMRPRLRLSDLDREDMRRAEHIRTKDDPFHVGGKRDIRLEAVVMLREINETLGLEIADVDQVFLVAE